MIHVAQLYLVLDGVHVVETPGGAAAAADQSEVSTGSRDQLSANHLLTTGLSSPLAKVTRPQPGPS